MPHPPSEVFAADGELLGYIHSDTIYTPVSRATRSRTTLKRRDGRDRGPPLLPARRRSTTRASSAPAIKDVFGHGGALQGASTLTMQLVDNMYLDGTKYAAQHDLKYKIVQAKLAEQLVKKHPGRPARTGSSTST